MARLFTLGNILDGLYAPLRSPPGARDAPVTSGARLLGDGARARGVR